MSLNINNLTHKIVDGVKSRQLFYDFNLTINQNETVALMGDSGSGKTTMLNLIAGLEPIQSGEIQIDGHNLSQQTDKVLSYLRKNYLGIIFQQFNLLSGLTVKDNIAFSAKLNNRFDYEFCQQLANNLGVDHLLNKFPDTLSGGEMQRVAIARALAAKPKLILADEPTGNLDENNSEGVVSLLVQMAKKHQTSLLMVTHSKSVAAKMDKIFRLEQGKLNLVPYLACDDVKS